VALKPSKSGSPISFENPGPQMTFTIAGGSW